MPELSDAEVFGDHPRCAGAGHRGKPEACDPPTIDARPEPGRNARICDGRRIGVARLVPARPEFG